MIRPLLTLAAVAWGIILGARVIGWAASKFEGGRTPAVPHFLYLTLVRDIRYLLHWAKARARGRSTDWDQELRSL